VGNKNTKNKLLTAVLVVAIICIAGIFYYTQSPTSNQTELLTGKIDQKGSDTLLLLAQRWAEDFMNKPEYTNVQIAVSGGGSGTGIAAMINGEIDLADASRPMKQKEIDLAKEKNINPIEWKVALDGIAVIVNPDNPSSELTLETIRDIYTGKTTNWNEIGKSEGRIISYGRQSNSGTYVFFQEHVLEEEDYRNDMQSLNGNADIVESVARDKNGIGYVGIAYAEQRERDIKIIKVKTDTNSPAILPTLETIADGSYPISRFLFIYSNGIPTGVVTSYLQYILSDEGQQITEEVGFISLPDEMQQQQLSQLGS
jgi:phosphate transport system substrate-binding protein